MVRIMAGETRFHRRILSKMILQRAHFDQDRAIGTILESGQSDVTYVVFIGTGDRDGNYAAYPADRSAQLHTRCIAAKAVRPDKRYVLGIALDAIGVRGSSEDFVLLDTKNWSAEALAKAVEMRKELGYFLTPGAHYIEDEYPQPE